MKTEPTATTPVARFTVAYSQVIDADGYAHAPLPAFAKQPEPLLAMYRMMVATRAFDQKAVALQRTGQLGTYASCLGQEAIGTAIGFALRDEDIFMPAYREYAAQFARGVPMQQMLLYWGGDERGMAYPEDTPAHHDFPLSVPIGTHVPQAIGVAYALKLRREPRVVLVSCGDGATSKGDFYEAISSARLWNLPVVFVISNNQWAISLPRARQTGAETLAQKGIAGGLHSEQVDGNDLIALRAVLDAALARARAGQGPSLVEALTYRLHDHTTADDARRYRDDAEVQAAWLRCPIRRSKAWLLRSGYWDEPREQALLAEAKAAAENAAQLFLATAPEPPTAIFEHLYAKLPPALRAQREEVAARHAAPGAPA